MQFSRIFLYEQELAKKKQDEQAKTQIKQLSKSQLLKLQDYRIIQKHLVYVIGLSSKITDKEILNKPEYFGQYGQITKLIVNKNKAYNPNGPNGPSYSAYVTYNTPYEAALAVLATDNIEMDGHLIKTSFGTTKYCTFFLKGKECPTNKECLYLHYLAPKNEVITKDDTNNKLIFSQQQNLAIKTSDLFNNEVRKKLTTPKSFKSVLPSTDLIYQRDFVVEVDPMNKNNNLGFYEFSQKNNKFTPLNDGLKSFAENEFRKDTPPFTKILDFTVNDYTDDSSKKNKSFDSTSQKYHSSDELIDKNDFTSTTSSSSNEEKSALEAGILSKQRNIYRCREQSRFSFVEDKKESDAIHVPEFINKFLYKKFSGHAFFKFSTDYDLDLICLDTKLDEPSNINTWKEFLLSNNKSIAS